MRSNSTPTKGQGNSASLTGGAIQKSSGSPEYDRALVLKQMVESGNSKLIQEARMELVVLWVSSAKELEDYLRKNHPSNKLRNGDGSSKTAPSTTSSNKVPETKQKSALTHKRGIGARVDAIFHSLAVWSGFEKSDIKMGAVALAGTISLMVGSAVAVTQTDIGRDLIGAKPTVSKKIRTKAGKIPETEAPAQDKSSDSKKQEDASNSLRSSVIYSSRSSDANSEEQDGKEPTRIASVSRHVEGSGGVECAGKTCEIHPEEFMKNPDMLREKINRYNKSQGD